jgi:hypothetical protein
MTTVFKNTLQANLGAGPATVMTSNASAKTTVIGFSLTNTTSFIILATVQLQDTITSTSAYYINNVPVPPNQSLRIVTGGEKLILGPSTNVIVTTSQASSLDLAISYVEIS